MLLSYPANLICTFIWDAEAKAHMMAHDKQAIKGTLQRCMTRRQFYRKEGGMRKYFLMRIVMNPLFIMLLK
jgi:hypothetical protein